MWATEIKADRHMICDGLAVLQVVLVEENITLDELGGRYQLANELIKALEDAFENGWKIEPGEKIVNVRMYIDNKLHQRFFLPGIYAICKKLQVDKELLCA